MTCETTARPKKGKAGKPPRSVIAAEFGRLLLKQLKRTDKKDFSSQRSRDARDKISSSASPSRPQRELAVLSTAARTRSCSLRSPSCAPFLALAATDPGPAPAAATSEPAAATQQGAPPHMPLAAAGGVAGGDAPDAAGIETRRSWLPSRRTARHGAGARDRRHVRRCRGGYDYPVGA